MTLVICDKTDCAYSREAQTSEEKAMAQYFCGKTYIVIKKPEENSCDDYEKQEL